MDIANVVSTSAWEDDQSEASGTSLNVVSTQSTMS